MSQNPPGPLFFVVFFVVFFFTTEKIRRVENTENTQIKCSEEPKKNKTIRLIDIRLPQVITV